MNKSDLLATALLGSLAGLALYEGFSIKAPALTDLFEQHVRPHAGQQQAALVNRSVQTPAPVRMAPVRMAPVRMAPVRMGPVRMAPTQKGWGMTRGRPIRYRERATVLPIPP